MEFGGIQAAVGNAGSAGQLAITRAADLAGRGGAGGGIVIEVRHSPETEVRIVEKSIRGAQVRVVEDMRLDSPLSKATKQILS